MGDERADGEYVEREARRLALSIEDAQKRLHATPGLTRVVAVHFPPLYANATPTVFSELIEAFRPAVCVYGHLHGAAGIRGRLPGRARRRPLRAGVVRRGRLPPGAPPRRSQKHGFHRRRCRAWRLSRSLIPGQATMNPLITSLLVFVGLTVFVYIMYGRTSVLLAMKPENRLDHLAERTRALLRFGLGQKRMVDPEELTPGVMHVFIFVAFLVLAMRTLMLFAMGFSSTLLDVLSTPTDPFWLGHPTAVDGVRRLPAGQGPGRARRRSWASRTSSGCAGKVKPDRMTPLLGGVPHPGLHRRPDGDRVHLRRVATWCCSSAGSRRASRSPRRWRCFSPAPGARVRLGARRGVLLDAPDDHPHVPELPAPREALPRHHRPAERLLPAAGPRSRRSCPRRTSRRRSSAPGRSRTSPGSRASTSTPAPSAAAARPTARRTSPASR